MEDNKDFAICLLRFGLFDSVRFKDIDFRFKDNRHVGLGFIQGHRLSLHLRFKVQGPRPKAWSVEDRACQGRMYALLD